MLFEQISFISTRASRTGFRLGIRCVTVVGVPAASAASNWRLELALVTESGGEHLVKVGGQRFSEFLVTQLG